MARRRVETDLLVVGSGAAALGAAVTAVNEGADVLVVEKSDRYGGTSAMSGGGIWIPNSENARRIGEQDSTEDAVRYMLAVIGDQVSEERIRAYVEAAPQMLEYLQQNSHLRYEAYPYPDYYPEQPGAKRGYRTQAPKVFPGRKLGDDLYRMRPQAPGSVVQGRFTMTFKEGRKFLTQDKGWRLTLLRVVLGYYLDLPARRKGRLSRRLTQGHSMIGSLYLSLRDKGGELWLNAPMLELSGGPSRVTGAVVERSGETVDVVAKLGVVLAAGGFEHNGPMRAAELPAPTDPDWSVSQENNTGDAIQAARAFGAKTTLMQHAWWIPVIHVPGWPRPMGIFAERSLPGLVIVDKQGQRFANEALPYLESGFSMYQANACPSWVVFDAKFRRRYPFGPLGPGWATPDKALPRKVRDILIVGDSIDAVADHAGLDAKGLRETIEKNNRYAQTGVDEDFRRGESFYDQYYGDPRNTPNPCIASIDKPPYYALPLYPGDIGTKGGLLTDVDARVVNEAGEPIPGLYAAGNTSASVMGDKYVGAGATLGPALTFGYLAARHAVATKGKPERGA